MKLSRKFAAVAAGALLAATANAQAPAGKSGTPKDNLPANVTQLTWFGERPSWSPDGKRIAFMNKSYGDAFEIEVATGRTRLLTPYQHAGYLRAQYLPNGDLFLIGAPKFEDIHKTRFHDQEMWILKRGSITPIRLGQKISEGVATSRRMQQGGATTIAWSNDWRNYPEQFPEGESGIFVADLAEQNGTYALVNKREVVRAKRPDCVLEAQDFRDNDRELIYVCYVGLPVKTASVFGVDLKTGKRTTYRALPNEYNEVEGIYPDGRYTLVESSREQVLGTDTSKYIDIWKLRLESGSKDFTRLTSFGDWPGYKSSNPVVSPDGRTIAFQQGRSKDPAGVGYGIFLLREQ